jgi:hypothetical protein
MARTAVHTVNLRRLGFTMLAGAAILVSGRAPGTDAATNATPPPRAEISAENFSPALFDESSATITNRWVPYTVGKRFVWRGSSIEDGERKSHRIVFTATDMTKVINKVRTLVGWERDYSGGELVESELIFLAQDRTGNVWHFGQYSEIWEGREFAGGSAWLVGELKGARAGIYMKAHPRVGTPAYSQGFAPAPYYWDDWSKVEKTHGRNCIRNRCYRNVLVVDEFEPRKRGAHQLKYYAPGLGNIRVGFRGSDKEKETLVLDRVVRLRKAAMAEARRAVVAHEQRAYVYAGTAPAEAPR